MGAQFHQPKEWTNIVGNGRIKRRAKETERKFHAERKRKQQSSTYSLSLYLAKFCVEHRIASKTISFSSSSSIHYSHHDDDKEMAASLVTTSLQTILECIARVTLIAFFLQKREKRKERRATKPSHSICVKLVMR